MKEERKKTRKKKKRRKKEESKKQGKKVFYQSLKSTFKIHLTFIESCITFE